MFSGNGLRGSFAGGGMNLLPRVREQARDLASELHRSIGGARKNREGAQALGVVHGSGVGIGQRQVEIRLRRRRKRFVSVLGNFRGMLRILRQMRGVRESEPVFGREGDAPRVAGKLQLQGDLKELPHSARALNPGNTSADAARRLSSFRVRHLKRDPHILQHVVLGLVAAAVAIDDQRGSALGELAAERVHAGNAQGNGLHNARAAALAQLHRCAGYAGSRHSFSHLLGKFPAKLVHECKPPISCKNV